MLNNKLSDLAEFLATYEVTPFSKYDEGELRRIVARKLRALADVNSGLMTFEQYDQTFASWPSEWVSEWVSE